MTSDDGHPPLRRFEERVYHLTDGIKAQQNMFGSRDRKIETTFIAQPFRVGKEGTATSFSAFATFFMAVEVEIGDVDRPIGNNVDALEEELGGN